MTPGSSLICLQTSLTLGWSDNVSGFEFIILIAPGYISNWLSLWNVSFTSWSDSLSSLWSLSTLLAALWWGVVVVTTFTLLVFKKCRTSEFLQRACELLLTILRGTDIFGKMSVKQLMTALACLIRYQVWDEKVWVEVHDVEGCWYLPSFECEFLFEDHKINHSGIHRFSC